MFLHGARATAAVAVVGGKTIDDDDGKNQSLGLKDCCC
jgi:hypothetical protein